MSYCEVVKERLPNWVGSCNIKYGWVCLITHMANWGSGKMVEVCACVSFAQFYMAWSNWMQLSVFTWRFSRTKSHVNKRHYYAPLVPWRINHIRKNLHFQKKSYSTELTVLINCKVENGILQWRNLTDATLTNWSEVTPLIMGQIALHTI